MADAPQDVPDMHPGIAETYRRRMERLTAALAHPDDAAEAAEAIREIIDRIVITPGPTRRDLSVTLQGELGAILDWIDRTGKPGYKPAPDTASTRLSVSVKTRAGPTGPRKARPDDRLRREPGIWRLIATRFRVCAFSASRRDWTNQKISISGRARSACPES
jgi:hypothetical protein